MIIEINNLTANFIDENFLKNFQTVLYKERGKVIF